VEAFAMKWASPQWFWALVLVPLFYLAVNWHQAKKQKRFERFADPVVWPIIAPELNWRASLIKARLWIMAFVCLVLALARPQWGTREEVVRVTGLDILLVFDISNSMYVEDVVPSRLKKAKHFVRSLLDRLDGDRVGVVSFAASSHLTCPLTTDLDYVREQVDLLDPRLVINQGTDIGLALETTAKALDRGAEESSGRSDSDQRSSRVVILISDGEDHEEMAMSGAQKLKEKGARFYIFGVGTEKGGPVPTRDDAGQLHGYKRDNKGTPVVSTFRPEALMQLASAARGRYWTITQNENEIEELLQDLGLLNRSDQAEHRMIIYEDRFQWPLFVAILLLLIELSLPARKIRKVFVLAAIMLFFTIGPSERFAYGSDTSGVSIGTYLENEKGLKAFSQGNMEEAKKSFGEAQARSPMLPELQYNQGVIQMQEGEMDWAAHGFEGAVKGALERNDPRLLGSAFFNLGNALASKEDVNGAIQAYLKAIEAAKTGQDKALEDDARKNIELLMKQLKQNKEQQKQEQQNKQGQGQDQQKQDQEKQDQKNHGSPRSQRRNQFKSEKLTKEDADRVMAELSNREQELKYKLSKQRGRPQNQQKDW
jgi:Ca-activated chloride channel homolog